MESGRDTSSGGPGRGRHRQRSKATNPATKPSIRPKPDTLDDVKPEESTDVLPVMTTLFPDAPATGLAKFDLGGIPASVTPPRTWRRAAWFAVAASILVLVGLAYAAVALVTAPRKPDIVNALPGLPSGTMDPLPEPLMSSRPTTPPPSTRPPSSSPSPSPSVQVTRKPTQRSDLPAVAAPTHGPPTTTTSSAQQTAPPRTTLQTPVLLGPIADAQQIGDRTEQYFRQVTADSAAAYAMTTGQARMDGQDEIERRYGGVTKVEVEQITIDANKSKTRSTLRVHRKDGTVTTQVRELTFTYGGDPKIATDTSA